LVKPSGGDRKASNDHKGLGVRVRTCGHGALEKGCSKGLKGNSGRKNGVVEKKRSVVVLDCGGQKKRLGQRARRKLFEKMYGDDANHVKAGKGRDGPNGQAGQQVGNGFGWPREDKVQPSQGVGRSGSFQRGEDEVSRGSEENICGRRLGAEKGDVKGAAHPSWLAKQEEQRKLKLAPAGKKIVFGDAGEPVAKGNNAHAQPPRLPVAKAHEGSAKECDKSAIKDNAVDKSQSISGCDVVHPSWLAAKRKREEQQRISLARPLGTKITFD
jgi:hypothetical protein